MNPQSTGPRLSDRSSTMTQNQGASTPQTTTPDISQVADQAKEQTGKIFEDARREAMSQIAVQKDRAAESLGSVAQALRETGRQLRQKDQVPYSQFVDQAANTVEQFSTTLSERDVEEHLEEVQRFARQQPALFLGGAFFLGILASRFMKNPNGSSPWSGMSGSSSSRSQFYGSPGMSGNLRSSPADESPSIYRPTMSGYSAGDRQNQT